MRIMAVGDLHGNTPFAAHYILPTAAKLGVDAIVQVGDFGYWEHQSSGVEYLNDLDEAAVDLGIPIYFLRGNHDKLSLLLELYGEDVLDDGFLRVREMVRYIPDGLRWTWEGVSMRAFGGAYSVDKAWRLELEAERTAELRDLAAQLGQPHAARSAAQTLWFPEEELTDEQFYDLLQADSGSVDIIFSHDKPSSSNCGMQLKDEPECQRNQQWLQRALVAHKPHLWVHGHLHHRYTTVVRSGDDGARCTVIGLSCDDWAAPRFSRPAHAWILLELSDGKAIVVDRNEVERRLELADERTG